MTSPAPKVDHIAELADPFASPQQPTHEKPADVATSIPVAGAAEASPRSSSAVEVSNDSFSNVFGSPQPKGGAQSTTTTAAAAAPAATGVSHHDPNGTDALDQFVATLRKGPTAGASDQSSAASLPDPTVGEQLANEANGCTPSASAPVFPSASGGVSRRVPHRKSFKLTEAPPRSAAEEFELEIRAAAVEQSPTRSVTCAAMQIRPSGVSDTAPRRQFRTETGTSYSATGKPELPDPLPAPIALRCDFCIKFNSVCSTCHFKWRREHLKKRVERLMAYLGTHQESTRVIIFFASVAKGDVDFVQAFLDAVPDALHWSSRFQTLSVETAGFESHKLAESGRVFPLHVAIGCDRVDMAKLLISRGAPFRRTEKGLSPLDLLPHEVPERWSTMLATIDAFKAHVLCEKAKDLRKEHRWDEAAEQYQLALDIMPGSEHARCGLAKMSFDAGRLADCIERCDAILGPLVDKIQWGQFNTSTVELLRKHAKERFHDESHGLRGSVRRPCGCIVLDYVTVRVRRLPFAILVRNVFPFMDCMTAADLHRATRRMPLLCRTLADHLAAARPLAVAQWILQSKNGDRLLADLKRELPEVDHVKWEPPVVWRGFMVFAAADFNAVLISSFVEVANAKAKKKESVFSFGKKKDEPKTLWLSKQLQLHRGRLDEPWTVHPAGEWEVCAEPMPGTITSAPPPGASPSLQSNKPPAS